MSWLHHRPLRKMHSQQRKWRRQGRNLRTRSWLNWIKLVTAVHRGLWKSVCRTHRPDGPFMLDTRTLLTVTVAETAVNSARSRDLSVGLNAWNWSTIIFKFFKTLNQAVVLSVIYFMLKLWIIFLLEMISCPMLCSVMTLRYIYTIFIM